MMMSIDRIRTTNWNIYHYVIIIITVRLPLSDILVVNSLFVCLLLLWVEFLLFLYRSIWFNWQEVYTFIDVMPFSSWFICFLLRKYILYWMLCSFICFFFNFINVDDLFTEMHGGIERCFVCLAAKILENFPDYTISVCIRLKRKWYTNTEQNTIFSMMREETASIVIDVTIFFWKSYVR